MTREESLKILRDTHDKALFSVRNALETLIPELAESEDERIRTELLSSFKGIMADADEDELWYGLPYNDIIAYLEKQKEQKPAEWSEEDREMRMKVLKYLSTRCSVNEYEEVEDWLKSLRPQPHWKPSKEQME